MASDKGVGETPARKGSTGQFMRQGHTAGPVNGSDPNITAMGVAKQEPRELRPN